MSKVKKEIIEAAVIKLMTDITSTMPNNTYKFILGSATAFATMNSKHQLETMLNSIVDKDGLIDVDMLKNVINSGFTASNGQVQIELFRGNGLLSMLLKPITVTINKSDIDKLFLEIEANSIQNVQIPQQPALSAN